MNERVHRESSTLIAICSCTQLFRPAEVLARQADPAGCLYIIRSGLVCLLVEPLANRHGSSSCSSTSSYLTSAKASASAAAASGVSTRHVNRSPVGFGILGMPVGQVGHGTPGEGYSHGGMSSASRGGFSPCPGTSLARHKTAAAVDPCGKQTQVSHQLCMSCRW